MGRKKLQEGEVNKSQAIRDLLKENPKIKANDAVAALAEKGVRITGSSPVIADRWTRGLGALGRGDGALGLGGGGGSTGFAPGPPSRW